MVRSSRYFCAVAASLLLWATLPTAELRPIAAVAADLPEPKVMIVDSQRILREAQAVQKLQAEIDAERDAFREELRQREIELRDADAALTRERPTLTNEEYLARRRELEQRFARYQNEIADRRRSLEGTYAGGMRLVEGRLLEIIGQLAKERGANLVLPKSAVLLGAPEFDETEEVMKRLNDSLPHVVPPAE